jgi:hypothetical protein
MQNLTPDWKIIPLKDKVVIEETNFNQKLGGLSLFNTGFQAGSGNEVFKMDANGIFLGSANFSTAPFSVAFDGSTTITDLTLTGGTIKYGKTTFADSTNAGYFLSSSGLYFGSAADANYIKYTIGTGAFDVKGAVTATAGSVLGTSYLSGTISMGNLNVANRGWVQTCVFSVTDADTVAWGAGTLTDAGGIGYSIDAGSTGNMSAKTYIYLDTAVSTSVYQTTTTATTAVGAGKVMIAIAQNATNEATYQVLQGQGGQNIDAANIVTGSITANEIAASTITAGKMSVTDLSTISANIGTITAGSISVINGGNTIGFTPAGTNAIFSGPTSAPTFYVTPAGLMTAVGGRYVESYTTGENITDGDIVCVKPKTLDPIYASDDSYVSQAAADTNYGTETTMLAGYISGVPNKIVSSFVKFDLTTVPAAEYILKAELVLTIYQTIGTVTEVTIQRVSSADWAEGTITYNNQPNKTDDIRTYYGGEVLKTPGGGNTTISFDITQLLRNQKDAAVTNYGYWITSNGSSGGQNYIAFYTGEHATTAYHPYLRIVTTQESDGLIYKADADDYSLCRSILGVAQETKTTGNACKIQTHGTITNITWGSSAAGAIAYLGSTAGAYVTSTNNATRVIPIARVTGNTTAQLAVERKGVFIEKPVNSLSVDSTAFPRFYAPSDATKMCLYISSYGGSDYGPQSICAIRGSSGNQVEQFRLSDGALVTITWNANYVAVTASASITLGTYYFYT